MDVSVLMNVVIHVVALSTALGAVIHQDLKQIGYLATSSGCDKVGQILVYPNDACSYLVCDHGLGSSSAEHKLVARRMPCAPGSSVPPDYNKKSGSSNPCVVSAKVPCNAPLITFPHRPHGRKGVDVGVPIRTGIVNTNNNRNYFPRKALHMMDLVWNRIQDTFKHLDHRKSLKSYPLVKLDLEKHMANLQHLWERMMGMVGSMLQRQVRGAGKPGLKDGRKPGRSSREISELKNLWVSIWENIRELEALEVEYAGAKEPLGLGWDDGERPGDGKRDHQRRERYLERKQQQRLQGKSVRYGRPKKYEANDISRFDYSEPDWGVYDKMKMYRSKEIRRPPHRPVYAGPKAGIYPDHGEDHGEGHQHMAEHEHYQPPSQQEDHDHNPNPYTEDKYGDLYPDGNVPVEHQEEYPPPDGRSYLQGEHQEGVGSVHHPLHLQYTDREKHHIDNSPQQEHHPEDYHPYDHTPDGTRQHPRDTILRRMPENSEESLHGGFRESNNVEPPLEAVDEEFDLSMVPSGYGNHMPLNTLWVQMKDVLTSMMENNKEELKKIPSDEELQEMKRKEAHRRQYEQEQSPPGGDHGYQEQSPPGGDHGYQEQSPSRGHRQEEHPSPGEHRHQEQSPPGGEHRSHQVLSNRPLNFVNYGSARKAGSERGPQHLSQIGLEPVITTPRAVTVKLPQNKQEFDDLKRKDSALIDEQYERAKQQWEKISQG